MAIFGAIDVPIDLETVAREGFVVVGFAFNDASGPFTRIAVRCDGVEIGSTAIRHRRPDVASVFPAIGDTTCGFRVAASLPAGAGRVCYIEVCAFFENGETWAQQRRVTIGAHDYRESPYGSLLYPDLTHVYRRHDIYSVGPPSPAASEECVALLDSYLVPGERIIDVGCGVGAYGPPLLDAGIAWHGCDVNPAFIAQLSERGLPVTLVAGETLPFENGAFESAICIEVLEHIAEYDAFLAEVARVARRRALFSVPNAEAIPVLADRLMVPWHLLEADHKNFFTRLGLRATLERHFRHVEIVPYGVMPVASSNDAPVYYHLFAVAEL